MSTDPRDDNTTRYASKTRVARIPLTYYYKNDPVDKTKIALTFVAILGFGAWAAFGLVADPKQHSPGPVASVHAMWNTQCAACHKDFQPTSGDSFALFGGPSRHGVVQCTQCHAAGAHHENLRTEEQACASCHREHRGLDAKLAQVADANCTSCHRALSVHAVHTAKITAEKPFATVAIRSFVDGHPEFKSLAQADPGRLKFSHARHMALGQKLAANDKERAKTLADLADADRPRYEAWSTGADKVIQLQCASCHETEPSAGAPPTRGDYMQPVNFERHCSACHKQTYAPVAHAELETMPHGLSPEQMRRAVKGEIVERFLDGKSKQPAAATEADPFGFPGKHAKDETTETAAFVNEHLPPADRMLRDRCLQCHSFPAGSKGSPLESPPVPTEVPSVWLKHARFDHRAHRAMSCLDCHAQAAAAWKPGAPTLDHEQVMIAGYDTCVKCHTSTVAGGTAGARFDCIACHRYHGADKPPGYYDRSFPGVTADADWNLKLLLAPK